MPREASSPAETAGTGEPATGTSDNSGGATTQPATGTASPATGATTGTGGASDELQLTPEQIQALIASNARMEAALREANGEAQRRREQAKEAERAKMTAEEAAKAELDELRQSAEEWEVERASLFLENQITRMAAKLGVIDPDVLTRLIDWDDLEFEDGRPVNTEEVVRAILDEKPYLVGKSSGQPARPTGINSGSGQGETPKVNLTAQELEAAKGAGLSPERYQALKGVQTLDDWLATRKTGQGN